MKLVECAKQLEPIRRAHKYRQRFHRSVGPRTFATYATSCVVCVNTFDGTSLFPLASMTFDIVCTNSMAPSSRLARKTPILLSRDTNARLCLRLRGQSKVSQRRRITCADGPNREPVLAQLKKCNWLTEAQSSDRQQSAAHAAGRGAQVPELLAPPV
jgi:hypothetical protein